LLIASETPIEAKSVRTCDGGLKVPEDLSVVGLDDILIAEYAQPALTTVAVPRTEIGKVAFEALWTMVTDPEAGAASFPWARGW
jgi:DNA-binding LacI/PurR family transcriptional regulator